MRLLAPNPEPNSVIYDPISLRVGTGKVFWPSREVNRAIRELIRLISELRDLAVISNLHKPSARLVLSHHGFHVGAAQRTAGSPALPHLIKI